MQGMIPLWCHHLLLVKLAFSELINAVKQSTPYLNNYTSKWKDKLFSLTILVTSISKPSHFRLKQLGGFCMQPCVQCESNWCGIRWFISKESVCFQYCWSRNISQLNVVFEASQVQDHSLSTECPTKVSPFSYSHLTSFSASDNQARFLLPVRVCSVILVLRLCTISHTCEKHCPPPVSIAGTHTRCCLTRATILCKSTFISQYCEIVLYTLHTVSASH